MSVFHRPPAPRSTASAPPAAPSPPPAAPEPLPARLERLERRLRRTRLLALGGVLGVLLLTTLGSAPGAWAEGGVQDVVRATSFEVVHPNGRTLATLGYDDDGGLLRINDYDGRTLTWVAVDTHREGGLIAIGNRQRNVIRLHVDRDTDGGRLYLGARDGTTVLATGDGGSGGYLRVNEPDGSARVVLP